MTWPISLSKTLSKLTSDTENYFVSFLLYTVWSQERCRRTNVDRKGFKSGVLQRMKLYSHFLISSFKLREWRSKWNQFNLSCFTVRFQTKTASPKHYLSFESRTCISKIRPSRRVLNMIFIFELTQCWLSICFENI